MEGQKIRRREGEKKKKEGRPKVKKEGEKKKGKRVKGGFLKEKKKRSKRGSLLSGFPSLMILGNIGKGR